MITVKVVEEALEGLARRRCHRGSRRMPGFTYVIRSPLANLIKIGMSHSPVKRLTEIQIVNADSLVLDALVHGAWLEAELHKELVDVRRHGEWFASVSPIPFEPGPVCYGCLTHRAGVRPVLDVGVQRRLIE